MSAPATGYGRTVAKGITWEKLSAFERQWVAVNDPEAFDAILADKRAREDGRPYAEHIRAIERGRGA